MAGRSFAVQRHTTAPARQQLHGCAMLTCAAVSPPHLHACRAAAAGLQAGARVCQHQERAAGALKRHVAGASTVQLQGPVLYCCKGQCSAAGMCS